MESDSQSIDAYIDAVVQGKVPERERRPKSLRSQARWSLVPSSFSGDWRSLSQETRSRALQPVSPTMHFQSPALSWARHDPI